MSGSTNIAWTNKTWNPVRGCERVSEGCRNCYAEVLAARHSYEGGWGHEVAHYVGGMPRWTGVIETKAQQVKLPLKWRKPCMIFVNSMSDLFHARVPFNFVDELYEVMDRCPQHTFQILTKRPERMLHYLMRRQKERCLAPIANVWHGVSAEDQETFNERVTVLRQVPAAVRFVSAEPLLGKIDADLDAIHWLIVGGESGPNRREMNMYHARSLIAQCRAAGVPIFIKQDSGPRPGMQGRFTDEEWAIKEYPA